MRYKAPYFGMKKCEKYNENNYILYYKNIMNNTRKLKALFYIMVKIEIEYNKKKSIIYYE